MPPSTRKIQFSIACAFLAISLASCETTSAPAPEIKIVAAVPADLESCFRRSFPSVKDADLSGRDAIRLLFDAKDLDKIKTNCGERAIAWMKKVSR